MKNNTREYQTIRFFRGRKRNNDEMQRLSDAGLDFEYRRLLIEENELDLHVSFSKMMIYELAGMEFSCSGTLLFPISDHYIYFSWTGINISYSSHG